MPTIDEIEIADEPGRWAALGFDVDGERAASSAPWSLRLPGEERGSGVARLVAARARRHRARRPAHRALRAQRRPPGPAHPNGVVAIDHVVAVSPSFERSVEAMRAAGLDLRRMREEPTPAGAPRQAFFRLGSEILELVQEPEEVVAREGRPDRPARFWGLALLVEDIDATVAAMAPHAGAPRAAVQPGGGSRRSRARPGWRSRWR